MRTPSCPAMESHCSAAHTAAHPLCPFSLLAAGTGASPLPLRFTAATFAWITVPTDASAAHAR